MSDLIDRLHKEIATWAGSKNRAPIEILLQDAADRIAELESKLAAAQKDVRRMDGEAG